MAVRHDMNDRGLRWGEGFVEVRTATDGSSRFQARWPEPQPTGRVKFRSKTFTTSIEDAEDHIRKQTKLIREGRYAPESKLNVRQIVEEYLKRGAHRWTSNTVATYTLTAKRQIYPHLEKKPVVALTPRMVQLWIDDLVAQKLSASLIENARIILSGAIKEAIQMGVRETNPTIDLKIPTRKKPKLTIWSLEDAQRVFKAVASDSFRYAFYMTAVMTGMRPGELRALQWRDINTREGIITCRRTMTRDEHFRAIIGTETKTHRNRTIAIAPSLINALERWQHDQKVKRIAHRQWNDIDIVFDRGNGNFLPLTNLEKIHVATCTEAGVARIRLHDMRHTSATMELEAGTNPKVVAERLGHASVSTTLDRYSHVSPELQRSAAHAMADRLFPAVKRARSRARSRSV